MSKKIGYPGALHFHEFFPFFRTFFQELGLDVVTSEPTTDKTVAIGDELALSQTCLAQKVAYAHTQTLLEDPEVDKVFVPTFVSGEGLSGNPSSQMCVYVQGNSGLQISRFGKSLEDKIVAPVLEFGKGKEKRLNQQLHAMAHDLNPSKSTSQVDQIITNSIQSLENFGRQLREIGNQAIQEANEKGDPLFVLLARYYVARDPRLNNGIDKIVQEKGFNCISMDMLPLESAAKTSEFNKAHSNLFWAYHQRMLAAAHIIRGNEFLKPIYVTCFPCGPDSFIMDEVNSVLDGRMLTIKVDSADMAANTRTRVESYVNTILSAKGKQSKPKKGLEDPLLLYNPVGKGPNGRTVLLNLMCDHGQTVAATLRSKNISAFCLEPNNEETLLEGKKQTDDGACIPCAETGGHFYKAIRTGKTRLDRPGIVMDSKLRKKLGPYSRVQTPQGEVLEINFNPKDFAFFQGTTAGPCRYGQYLHQQARKTRELHQRKVIAKGLGQGKELQEILESDEYQQNSIRFFTLNSKNSYALSGERFTEGIRSQAAFWKHLRAVDILQKVRNIQRVKEATVGDVDEIYEETLRGICRRIERKKDYMDILYTAAAKLTSIPTRDVPPVFGQVVGEIYVRQNEHINRNVVKSLEQESVGSIVSPFGLWIKYVTGLHLSDLRTQQSRTSITSPGEKLKLARDIATTKARLWYQENSERKLELPFLPITGSFPDPLLDEIMTEGRKYIDPAFTGEAIVSAAELSLAMGHGFSSALNLMPFTCMPSNVVIGLEPRIRGENEHFPIAHLEYDGSRDATYEDRLSVHAFQSHKYFEKHADQILATQRHHQEQALKTYNKKADSKRRIRLPA